MYGIILEANGYRIGHWIKPQEPFESARITTHDIVSRDF